MHFKLRNKEYQITNPSDVLLVKLEKALTNKMQDIGDDEIAAYVISKACPDIPNEFVSYSKDGFTLALKSQEIVSFSFSLTIGILEQVEVKSSEDKKVIDKRVNQLKELLTKTDQTINSEQMKAISGSIEDIEKLLKAQSNPTSPTIDVKAYTADEADDKVLLMQTSSSDEEVAILRARLAELENKQ